MLSPFAAAPAQAQATELWSATLTAVAGNESSFGCFTELENKKCSDTAVLSDNDFSRLVGGTATNYTIVRISDQADGKLLLNFNATGIRKARFSGLKFCIGSTAFAFSDSTSTDASGESRFVWNSADLAWSAGTVVNLKIASACPATPGAVTDLSATRGVRKLDLSWTAPTGDEVTGYDVHYTSSATVKNDTPDAEPSGNDASTAWVDAGHTGTAASDEITGLTSLIVYYVRVRAVNDAGGGAWEVVSGIAAPEPHGPKMTPDFDLLVTLTFNDGVRDLPITPTGAGGLTGLGNPYEYKYYVHVPPGVRSVTVTPTWTNEDIRRVLARTDYLSTGQYGPGAGYRWGQDDSGEGQSVRLGSRSRPVDGMTQLTMQVQGVTSDPYIIYLQHNNAWKSANDRLNDLAIEIGN